MKRPQWFRILSVLASGLFGLSTQAAPIPGLFGTGVDDAGTLLAAGVVDPHYKLITSADTNFPGPDTIVVNQDFPIAGEVGGGPWLTNGPLSKWIAPQADQTCCGQGTAGGNGGNEPGDYVYRLNFTLTGLDLSSVRLSGQWACDSEGVDIKINGTSTGQKIAPYPPQPSESWHPFSVSSGFVEGANTLDFVVNRSSGKYPTGLRAELTGNGNPLPQATPVLGIFGTGVDANGALLPAGAADPHYQLTTSADTNFPGPSTIVVNQDFPIAGEVGGGPWLTNGPLSKWIAPQADQTCCGQGTAGGNGGNEPGDYVYRLSFSLTGYDLSSVRLTGQWACDSEGVDIKINGASTGQKIAPYPPQPSESWHAFTIASGFVDGINTLDFVINRSSGKYPTGLRADVSGSGVRFPEVPGLFNTGIDDQGGLLAAGAVDPHYKLITSADTNYPGPDTIVVNQDFPIAGEVGGGPWLTNGPVSKWIAPQADQTCCGQGTAGGNGGNEPGDYVYRQSFVLSGFDLSTVKLSGRWACDSEGVDIKINGTSTGQKIPPYPPQPSESWHSFTINSGFVDGTNTLDFVINRSSGKYPTGLRAEVSGFASNPGGGNAAPEILVQPKSQAVGIGASASLLVSAKGGGLSYQWNLNGAAIAGATGPRLQFDAVKQSDFGVYEVVVSNQAGQVTSDSATLLLAVAVPGLFNTGTGDGGVLLTDGATDPHFRLVSSADTAFPGPNAIVVNDGPPLSPDGTWLPNGPNSRWIAPQADQASGSGGNPAGLYTYRITFDLRDLDPATVTLNGLWAAFAALPDLILNGKSTGLQIGPFEPDRLLRPFSIISGFNSGTNTLDFVVSAIGAADVNSSTGVRVELQGIAGQLPPNTPPSLLGQSQPRTAILIAGDSTTLSVAIRGSSPLSYQWRFNGTSISGATSDTLVLSQAGVGAAGKYDVVASNSAGSITNAAVTVVVLGKVPGLFATGVDEDGVGLADTSLDPHYQLITNANDPASKDVLVLDSTVYPIVSGPWLANSATSKWVGPWADPIAAQGDYVYRTTFDLTGFDPATVLLRGRWAADDAVTDLRLNGVSTGLKNSSGFAQLLSFVVTNGFVSGTNTLEIAVNNGGTDINPSGFRIDGLTAGGLPPGSSANVTLAISLNGPQVTVSWPASATGYALYSTASLSSPNWTPVSGGTGVSGDRITYQAQASDPAQFFRLQK